MTDLSVFARVSLVVALSVSFGMSALAQNQTAETSAAQTETVDPVALRDKARALLYGLNGMEQDVEAAIALLTKAAENQDTTSKALLGSILLDGYYVPQDAGQGIRYLVEAAQADNADAQLALGNSLLWGIGQDADHEAAVDMLDRAIANGNVEAARILGEQYIGGWALEQDLEKGLAYMRKAVADGDDHAMVALGDFYFYGTGVPQDREKARVYFQQAAESGNGEGLENYGTDLMWRNTSPRAAQTVLERAGELGRPSAWSTLAEGAMYGYLGKGSRQKFDDYAERALAAGQERIAVLEAQRRMWGISMRASGPKVISGLEEAASEGNTEATRYLISLVRNGNQYNIRKRPDQAEDYIDRYGAALSDEERAHYERTIAAARTRKLGNLPTLAELFDGTPSTMQKSLASDLYKANPNLVIYMLQQKLQAEGRYDGPVDGLAKKRTVNALYDACKADGSIENCADRVLQADVIATLLTK